MKSKFANELITSLCTQFTPTQLQIIYNATIKTLELYTLTSCATENAIVTVDNFNNELLQKFAARKILSGIATKSLGQYMLCTKNCLLTIDKKATEITANDLEVYLLNYKFQRKVSQTYLVNVIRWLNPFFTFLVEEDFILKNPIAQLPRVKGDTIPEPVFTKSEEEKLLLNCRNMRDRALLEVFLATGCRVSEVCDIQLSNISWEDNSIRIIGKGNKLRVVYISDKAKVHVDRYLASRDFESTYLFTGLRVPYKPLTPAGVESIMTQVGKRADIRNVHPHRFRSTFCTRMIDRGMPLHVVQQLMGHSSLDTTLRYYRGTGAVEQEFKKFSA